MRIVWDERKDRINRRKHRVSFAVAAEIFLIRWWRLLRTRGIPQRRCASLA